MMLLSMESMTSKHFWEMKREQMQRQNVIISAAFLCHQSIKNIVNGGPRPFHNSEAQNPVASMTHVIHCIHCGFRCWQITRRTLPPQSPIHQWSLKLYMMTV